MVARNTTRLKRLQLPKKSVKLSKEFFNNRTVVMATKNYTIERRITKAFPQGSCSGPGFWNILYKSLLTLERTSRSKAIATADDLIILTRGETVAEAENYLNLELRKIQEWVQNNKMKFKENKSKVMLMFRRKRKESKEIDIYINKTQNRSTA